MSEDEPVSFTSRQFVHQGRASVSDCGRYRYSLFRHVPGQAGGHLCWLMLNPSTADAERDDPTIRKVLGFTSRAGFGGAWVINLFAWRSTDPRAVAAMVRRGDSDLAEGAENRAAIESAVLGAEVVVCAWGAHPWAQAQARRVLSWMPGVRALCIGLTANGAPLHPLMQSYTRLPFTPYEAAR